MTATQKHDIIPVCTTVLSADQQPKEDIMLDQQKITIIYCRLSVEDIKEDAKGNKADESNSIQNQKELLTEEVLEILTTPYDLADYKQAITECLYKGTKRNIESEENSKNVEVE